MPLNTTQNVILTLIMLSFAGAELAADRHQHFNATKDDGKLELVMFVLLLALIQPLIFLLLARLLTPGFHTTRKLWPVSRGG